MNTALAVRGLNLRHGKNQVLHNLNFEMQSTQLSALIGPNGSGKSTLLATLAGLRNAQLEGGQVLLHGEDITNQNPQQIANRIAWLPANPSLAFPLSVQELIEQGKPSHNNKDEAIQDLELGPLLQKPVTALSTGESKRAWLAFALARNTPILLLDEPLAGLDPRHQLRLLAALGRRANAGTTVLMVAHDLQHLGRTDRVLAVGEQRLVADGAPRAVLNKELLHALYGVDVWFAQHPDGTFAPVLKV